LVRLYAHQSQENWTELWPAIKELTDEPYIKMNNQELTMTDLVNQLKEEIKNEKAQLN